MLCFVLPCSNDVVLDLVVFLFGTETEYSGILCNVDGLEELGTARDGLTGSGGGGGRAEMFE